MLGILNVSPSLYMFFQIFIENTPKNGFLLMILTDWYTCVGIEDVQSMCEKYQPDVLVSHVFITNPSRIEIV